MKFIYPDIQFVFDTESNKVNTIVIENQQLFYELITDINNQMQGYDGRCVVSENDKILTTGKCLEMHSQFIPFTINQKVLVNKLIAEMEKKAVLTDYYEKTMELLTNTETFFLDLTFDFTGDIHFSKLNIGSLIRAAAPEFMDDYSSLSEKLIDYIELVTEYERPKLYIFVNLRSYLSDDETQPFLNTVLMRNFHVILIDNCEHKRLDNEFRYIVDKDLCEIM